MKLVPGRPLGSPLLLALPLLSLNRSAYQNPRTGGYAVQLLIGAVLGAVLALGVLWRRVVASIEHLCRLRPVV